MVADYLTPKKITRQHHIIDSMLDARVGDVLTLYIIRDNEEVKINVTITENLIVDY